MHKKCRSSTTVSTSACHAEDDGSIPFYGSMIAVKILAKKSIQYREKKIELSRVFKLLIVQSFFCFCLQNSKFRYWTGC